MMMIDVWLAILQVCYWKHRKIMGFIQLQVGKAKIYVYFLGCFLHLNTMQVWYPNSNCYQKLCSKFLTILNCVFQQRLDQGDSASVVHTLLLRVSRSYNNSLLTSSSPLSVTNLSTDQYAPTQFFMMVFVMSFGFFERMVVVTDSCVALSITYSRVLHFIKFYVHDHAFFKSIGQWWRMVRYRLGDAFL